MRQAGEGRRVGGRDGGARRRPGGGRTPWPALLGVLLFLTAAVSPAGAAPVRPVATAAEPLSITYVARDCPKYTDIMANKARNNIQESLRDLGPDTNYASAEAVSAQKEASGTPLPPCEPLTDWTFATGTGTTGPTAATQNLSTVTGTIRQDLTTRASTPELNAQGLPTGRTLKGAVTVPLNAAEQDALNRNTLRVQGGTPAQPLNGEQEKYGFGALRCAADALNGDNIEYLNFPSGARHVFCYYYAVTPPPGAGTIKVVKHLDGPGQGNFRFDGNISYADTNNDGQNDFVLSPSTGKDAEMTFVRGESTLDDDPWTFKEASPADSSWAPDLPAVCAAVAADGSPGKSEISTDSEGQVKVGLVEGETVTCTYTNRRTAGKGLLAKETLGGTGTFDIDLEAPPAAPPIDTRSVTTTEEGVPVTVASNEQTYAGDYTAVEQKPAADGRGTWELTSAVCGGEEVPVVDAGREWRATHTVVADENPDCLLTNTFTPGGAISVEKVTKGGTGTFGYAIIPNRMTQPAGQDPTAYRGFATTTAPDVVTPARHFDGTGNPLADELEVSDSVSYTVQEYLPPATDAGHWELTDVDCEGAETGLTRGTSSVDVRLTPGNPTPTCRFTNTYVPQGTLQVVKTTSGDERLRSGDARLELECEDGTQDTLTVPAADTKGTLPRKGFNAPTTCVVTEPETGVATEATVDTSATLTVDGGDATPVGLGDSFPVRPGQTAVLRVKNTFTGPSPPGQLAVPAVAQDR